jgi:cellulose biosynthesis protein BcsQ
VAERYVVLGLARSRCRWFVELAHWATAGIAPIEFVKCLTADEARAVMAAGRNVSAVLLDSGLARLDRDLVDSAHRSGTPTFLVDDPRVQRDWEALGCATCLDAHFTRNQLVDALDRWARPVVPGTDATAGRADFESGPEPGLLIGVTGSGGAGTSTVAMAVAQGLADRGLGVALVDGCRRADLAMYHDVGDILPGLPELVELHRGDRVDPAEIRSLMFDIDDRGYRLVLGLRRARDWAGLRSRSVEAALDGLRRTEGVVVVDHDPDLEDEADTGSVDIEDRHAVALALAATADLVLVVVRPGVKGLHDLARIVGDLVRSGLPPSCIQPVLNGGRSSAATRAQMARAVRDLTNRAAHDDGVRRAAFIRSHRGMETSHRTSGRLPAGLCGPLATAVASTPPRTDTVERSAGARIRPGDLGVRGDVA